MKQATELMQHYGYTYKTIFLVWEKRKNGKDHHVPGAYSRPSVEHLIIGTKGQVIPLLKNDQVRQIIREETTGHSFKPMKRVYDILKTRFKIEDMNCLEVFARQKYMKEFDVYGDELSPKF